MIEILDSFGYGKKMFHYCKNKRLILFWRYLFPHREL